MAKRAKIADHRELPAYADLVGGIAEVLESARRASARAVNAVMTATYWEIGRRIVEYEQGGKERAGIRQGDAGATFPRPDEPLRRQVRRG